ncbi:MAG: SGNH/GDSL hydrolase family protein [Ruminococcaceae bacterium]|nr:SGNH/GDSL hydrolase family protein [Oscillospiraceae bacterium]
MMRLTFEQIKQISFGAYAVTQQENGIRYQRCTDKQIEAWGKLHHDLGERATYSSGISLDFHTSSKKLRIATIGGGQFEYYINGVLRAIVTMKEICVDGKCFELSLCDPLGDELGECRVTVCFPRGNSPVVIDYVELDDGASFAPHKYDSKMLFYGDSITQGYSSVNHSHCYARMVSSFFNAEYYNLGIGGGRFDISTVDDVGYEPDTVVIAFGTNDFTHHKTLEALKAKADEFMGAVKELHKGTAKNFFVISPLWRADLEKWVANEEKGRTLSSLAHARAAIIECAEKHGMIHINGLELVPPFPEYFRDEYLHPNDLGFCLYTQGVIKEMRKYIK